METKNPKYPEMTVEKREGKSHGLKSPTPKWTPEYKAQLQDVLYLCMDSKHPGYSNRVQEILWKHAPVKPENVDITELMTEFGHPNWSDVCEFVKDDECIEFFLMLVKFLKKRGVEFRKNRDFIDEGGTGLYRRYLVRLDHKEHGTLEQAFDEKYLHEETRPLEDLYELTGLDFSGMADYTHPGHFRYPAGHAAKFYEAADHACDAFAIEKTSNLRKIVIFLAYAEAMGRSGILVHLIEDNIAAGYLADLPEFNNWKK